VDEQDEARIARPSRPTRTRRLAYVAVQERAQRLGAGLRDELRGAPDRVRAWDDQQRSTSFVSPAETVVLDVRRHTFLLVWPLARTLTGLLALVVGTPLQVLVLFGIATGLWARARFSAGLQRAALVAPVAAVGLLLVAAVAGPSLVAVVLLLWAVEDVADWSCDRLVVSDKRIYRRYGVFTRHSPSIALTAIAFIDAAVPPLGRVMRYGTLRLDSVAQRDAPLARLDLVPDVVGVSHEVLRLRAAAMPKYPPQPF
jgi:membrane protein YdbS with pleckstrin-like domain